MLYNPPTGSSDPNAPYVGKDVVAGTQGSKVPKMAIEGPMREIVNTITAAGIEPTNADLTQLMQAVKKLGLAAANASKMKVVFGAGPSSWVCPPGITRVEAKGRGAAGGGGGAAGTTYTGGGGGGGACFEGVFTVVPGTTYPILVGTGGLAGSAAGSNGGNGTATSFSSFATAPGGNGGVGGTSGNGAPGSATAPATGGTVNKPGNGGGPGQAVGGTGQGGTGGGSYGQGASNIPAVGGGAGLPGSLPGIGGNGGGGLNYTGGAGADGELILEF